MARSLLFARLAAALATHRRSHLSGAPIADLLASQRMQGALTRRRLLAGVAGAAAVAALPGCGGARAAERSASVAIVGGGIAGLHCAHRLAKLGVRADLYDAGKRLGGRIISDRRTFAPLPCELGGELIDTGHETMHRPAAELDIRLHDYAEDTGLDGMVGYVGGRKLGREEMVLGLAPIAAAVDEALATLKDPEAGVTHADPNGGEALDKLSLRQWLDQIGAQGPMRTVVEVAYTIEFGLEPDECNVLNLLMMIDSEAENLALFGESDERFHAADGNDVFTSRLAAGLDGAQVRLDHALERIAARADGTHRLSFANGREADYEHVVMAIPFSILRGLDVQVELPVAKLRAIAQIGYGANTKLMVGFTNRLWRAAGSDGQVFTDLPFQNTWDTSRMQPGDAGIVTNFTGGQHARDIAAGSADSQAKAFLADFERVFPGARAAATGASVRMAWHEQPWVRGSYSSYKPGQYTAFAGSEGERVGNLHFCGEHTCLDAQGYMEGGALSGEWASDEVAEDLGLRKAAFRGGLRRDRRLARRREALQPARA